MLGERRQSYDALVSWARRLRPRRLRRVRDPFVSLRPELLMHDGAADSSRTSFATAVLTLGIPCERFDRYMDSIAMCVCKWRCQLMNHICPSTCSSSGHFCVHPSLFCALRDRSQTRNANPDGRLSVGCCIGHFCEVQVPERKLSHLPAHHVRTSSLAAWLELMLQPSSQAT